MSYTQHFFHVVFATKGREPLIQPTFQGDLYHYIGGIIRGKQGTLIEIGGITDHIHILAQFHQSISHADMIRDIKSASSRWVNENGVSKQSFRWQTKYGSFSVSASNVQAVKTYIQNQEAHHRTVTFEEEFKSLLLKHGVSFNPNYWLE